jgi:outer membrane protein OmpA-like peptidoglycan-associated protein
VTSSDLCDLCVNLLLYADTPARRHADTPNREARTVCNLGADRLKWRLMTKSSTKASRSPGSLRRNGGTRNTPAGVWVIVGMAFFLVAAGLGISAFIAWKAIADLKLLPTPIEAAGESSATPNVAKSSNAEAGIEHPKPITRNAGPSQAAAPEQVEQGRVRQEVLKRIDLMRGLSDADKDKLYVQVERARGFTKVGTVPFAQGGTTPGAAQIEGLVKSLNEAGPRTLLADPTVILIMVGYADKQGEETKNVEVSRTRAENVVKLFRAKTDLPNVMHAVGMGGQDLFDQSNLEKNRLVEVWAAQP